MTAPSVHPEPHQRILVIRNRFIGDTALAVPFLRNLRLVHPDARIDALLEPGSGDVLAHCPYLDRRIFWKRQRPARGVATRPDVIYGFWPAVRALRAQRYDKVYILRRSFSSALLAWCARIPVRIGHAVEGRRLLLTQAAPMPEVHEVDRFLSLLEAEGHVISDRHNEGWVDPTAAARVAPFMSPGARRVFFCGRSSRETSSLNPDRMAAVVHGFVEGLGLEVHLCDSPANAPHYAAMLALLPQSTRSRVRDWSATLSLREFPSLLPHMHLAVGVDTGLMHLCAQFHLPLVVIYGFVDPQHWHPWDTRYQALRAPSGPDGNHNVNQVPLEEIQRAVHQLLSENVYARST